MDTFVTFDCPAPGCNTSVGIDADIATENPGLLVRCIGPSVGQRHVLRWMVRRTADVIFDRESDLIAA